MGFDFELICLQKHPEFIDACITLLNTEWPRSKTARLVSIQQGSSEGFPTTLVLIDKTENGSAERLVAHCKVSPVSVYHPSACFVESVVVTKDLRGQGIGRIIMDKMENYVKCRGIRTIFLTTHDQQGFYQKLGYLLCDPVVVYGGGKLLCNAFSIQKKDKEMMHDNIDDQVVQTLKEVSLSPKIIESNAKVPMSPPPPPPPPPAPPFPKKSITKDSIILMPHLKVTMKKELV